LVDKAYYGRYCIKLMALIAGLSFSPVQTASNVKSDLALHCIKPSLQRQVSGVNMAMKAVSVSLPEKFQDKKQRKSRVKYYVITIIVRVMGILSLFAI